MRSTMPRSSKISWVRGCTPLPRDPRKGLSSFSMSRKDMFRRANSMASVRPAAPAPQIKTSAQKLPLMAILQYAYNTLNMGVIMPRNKVHSARIDNVRTIFAAVVDLVGIMNRPQRDARMIEEAGIVLDRALFPLLVGVGRFG